MKNVAEILNYFDSIGPLVAIAAFSLRRNKLSAELKCILAFCIIQFVCNASGEIIGDRFFGNNYWIYKLNTAASLLVILLLFAKYLLPVKKTTGMLFAVLFILFNSLPMLIGDGITTFNSYSAALCSIAIVAYCLYFFFIKLIQSSPEESVPSGTIFWCIIGLFTYYAGAFFIFISYKFLIESNLRSLGTTLWRFHNLLLFIGCLYISYGVLCKSYQKISLSY